MTCGSEHNYRAPKVESKAAAAAKPRAAAGTAKAKSTDKAAKKPTSRTNARAEWESQVRSGRPFRRYAATETYAEGDLVQHKKFGDGYVREVSGKDKIIIAFADGDRTLVQGLPA